MNDTNILELRQIAENEWKAKYQGNYGIYTVRITTNGKKTIDFSCSCPSDYYPCKHIPMIEEAVARKMKAKRKEENQQKIKLEDFIKNVSIEKLREFIIAQAKFNSELENAVFFEFSSNITNTRSNKYSMIIRKALESVSLDENDYYHEDWMNIDIMDLWHNKAQELVHEKQYNEAILICKACIEEYSKWFYHVDENISSVFSSEYKTIPFKIIMRSLKYINKKDILLSMPQSK